MLKLISSLALLDLLICSFLDAAVSSHLFFDTSFSADLGNSLDYFAWEDIHVDSVAILDHLEWIIKKGVLPAAIVGGEIPFCNVNLEILTITGRLVMPTRNNAMTNIVDYARRKMIPMRSKSMSSRVLISLVQRPVHICHEAGHAHLQQK